MMASYFGWQMAEMKGEKKVLAIEKRILDEERNVLQEFNKTSQVLNEIIERNENSVNNLTQK